MSNPDRMSDTHTLTLDPVSVVVNVHNEAQTIEEEIRAIHGAIVSRLPGSEFIVAEDGSTDGTHEIVARLCGELGLFHSTTVERKGYAKALRDAFLLSRCPYVFYSDTGNKHDPQDFWRLYADRRDYGLVVGVKTGRTDQWYRRLLTRIYNRVLSLYFGVHVSDADCGFRLYSRPVVQKIFKEPWINRDLIASELVLRAVYSGVAFKEVPISYRQRAGESRGLPLKKIPGVIVRVLRNFSKLRRILRDPTYRQGGVCPTAAAGKTGQSGAEPCGRGRGPE